MSEIFLIARWYHLLASVMLGLIIYFTILFILKEFKKEDFDLFLDTLSIKKMIDYIKGELGGKRK